MKYTSSPCGTCAHTSTGTMTGPDSVHFDGAPPPDCACECHAAWRMVNRVPALSGGEPV